MTLHAHISWNSRDCDGNYSGTRDMFFDGEETRESEKLYNDFSDIHFMNRVMASVASPYSVQYQMTVEVTEAGIDVHEVTDEGYRAANVRWCTDECEEENPTRRDHRAESMGY